MIMNYLKQNFIYAKDMAGKDAFIRIDSIKEIVKREDGKTAMLLVHNKNNSGVFSFQSRFEEVVAQLSEL